MPCVPCVFHRQVCRRNSLIPDAVVRRLVWAALHYTLLGLTLPVYTLPVSCLLCLQADMVAGEHLDETSEILPARPGWRELVWNMIEHPRTVRHGVPLLHLRTALMFLSVLAATGTGVMSTHVCGHVWALLRPVGTRFSLACLCVLFD